MNRVPTIQQIGGQHTATRFFQALADIDRRLAARGPAEQILATHHSVTEQLDLADVVVACRCTPDTYRDLSQWLQHVTELLANIQPSAATPPGAAVGLAPAGEAGASHPTPTQ